MRDYTGPNISYVKHYIRTAIKNTNHDYRNTYMNQSVPSSRSKLKYDSLCVGSDANSHIRSIRNRMSEALTQLEAFYGSIDYISSNIATSADSIVALLDEVNDAMDRINNALSGQAKYKGKPITAKDIEAAGINEATCAQLKEQYNNACMDSFLKNIKDFGSYIDEMKALKEKNGTLSPADQLRLKYLFDWYSKNQFDSAGEATNLSEQDLQRFVDVFKLLDGASLSEKMMDNFMKNDAAVALYLKDMKALAESGTIPPEDMVKLNKIYDWYVKNRFGSTNDVNDIKEQTLNNCIDAYELINPDAKKRTDDYFGSAPNSKYYNDNVRRNILRIKYFMYTCDPLYRDMLLGYLPKMKLKLLPSNDDVCCSAGMGTATLKLYLGDQNITNNICSFFHEAGHGIDYLTGKRSKDLTQQLKEDIRNELRKTIEEYNTTLPGDKRLSQDAINKLLDYLLDTNKNPNIVLKNGDAPTLPEDWGPELKDAYIHVRDQYGYYEYVYNDSKCYGYKATNGLFTGVFITDGIIIDIMGGVTNNKLCGGMGGGHPYDWKDGSPVPSTFKDFQNEIINGSYYHVGPFKSPKYDDEFYAEVFEYGCLHRDLSTTEKVFGSATATVKGYIYDAYKQVKDN